MLNLWLDPRIPRGVTRSEITPKGQTLFVRFISNQRLRPGDIFWEKGVQYILSTPFWFGYVETIYLRGTLTRGAFFSEVGLHDQSTQKAMRQAEGEARVKCLECAPKTRQSIFFVWHTIAFHCKCTSRGLWYIRRPVGWSANTLSSVGGRHCLKMPGLCCFKKRLKIGLCGGGDHTVFWKKRPVFKLSCYLWWRWPWHLQDHTGYRLVKALQSDALLTSVLPRSFTRKHVQILLFWKLNIISTNY